MKATHSVRRRVDYQVLRWQARLDGTWADRVIPLAATIGLFVVLAAMALARARSLETGDDLATWVQGAWLITTGRTADSTITGDHLLEPQLALGFYGLAQITRFVAPIPALLLLQSGALALGIGAVWRLCRNVCDLRVGAATAAIVAYAVHPMIHQLNLADVHPEAFAVPALLWAAYSTYRGRWRWAIPLFVVAVLMRSDLGLAVAAIGGSMVIGERARGGRRLLVGGLAYALIAQLVVQPRIGDGGSVHAGAFSSYGDDLPGVLWGMLSAPWEVVGDLVARDNFVAVVGLLAPVAFLALLAPRRLLPFAPVLAIAFVADVPVTGPEGVARLIPGLVGVFIALPFALEGLGRRNIERVTVDRRILLAVVAASLTFFVLDAPSSPYARPWEWGGRDQSDDDRLTAVAAVAPDERVRAAPSMIAELAERRVIRVLPLAATPSAAALIDGVDVVIVDRTSVEVWQLDDEALAVLHEELGDVGVTTTRVGDDVWVHRREE